MGKSTEENLLKKRHAESTDSFNRLNLVIIRKEGLEIGKENILDVLQNSRMIVGLFINTRLQTLSTPSFHSQIMGHIRLTFFSFHWLLSILMMWSTEGHRISVSSYDELLRNLLTVIFMEKQILPGVHASHNKNMIT